MAKRSISASPRRKLVSPPFKNMNFGANFEGENTKAHVHICWAKLEGVKGMSHQSSQPRPCLQASRRRPDGRLHVGSFSQRDSSTTELLNVVWFPRSNHWKWFDDMMPDHLWQQSFDVICLLYISVRRCGQSILTVCCIYPTWEFKPLSSGTSTYLPSYGEALKTYVGSADVRAIKVLAHQLLELPMCLNSLRPASFWLISKIMNQLFNI